MPVDHEVMLTDDELKAFKGEHKTWRRWWDDIYWTHRGFLNPAADVFAITVGIVWHAMAVVGIVVTVRWAFGI